ncbi:MAG: hypothetical protein H6Q19_920 [Bacteroidetes bacterium]|nr:hypothetical protein [Bacteroidota bacterium]
MLTELNENSFLYRTEICNRATTLYVIQKTDWIIKSNDIQ